MKVALDMDEVLCSLVKPVLENKKIPLKYKEITNYNLWEISDFSKEDAVKLFMDVVFEDYNKNHEILTPLNYTVDTVKKIRKKSDKIYIVTARSELLKKETYSWANRYFSGLIDEIVFTNKDVNLSFGDKAEVLKGLGIDLFVDDNLENTIGAVDAGIEKVFLVDRPWNQVKLDKSIIRIAALNEVLDYVD